MTESQQPDSEDVEKTNLQKVSALAIFACIAFLAFLAWIATWLKDHRKVYKKELYAPYCVDKKTFAQWIDLFCSDIISKEDYAQCRKLPMYRVTAIREQLGENTIETPVRSKKEIIAVYEGSYATLRESIKAYSEKFGITPSVFKALNCFPPKIATQICDCYKNGFAKPKSKAA